MITLSDDLERAVALPRPAERIVSLVPSLTETLFALGRGDAVVGVTRYCTEPSDIPARVERVGGTKNPDIARIGALQPDLVLINAEENRREDYAALEQLGLTVFVSFSHRARDVVDLIRKLGALAGVPAAAARMATALSDTLADVERQATGERLRVFCPIWKNPWMSFNQDTYADDMLWLAGGSNVCRDQAARYFTVTLDAVAQAAPEVILLPDEPYVFAPKDLPSLAPLQATPAHRAGRIHYIDGKALSWYGRRTAAALRYLRGILQG